MIEIRDNKCPWCGRFLKIVSRAENGACVRTCTNRDVDHDRDI
ncbi:hypothetical protein SEA_SICARIUS2_51 [Arthrobacter phage Sicarius2]|uniref:Uncharacterized protein n=1 Tax=Arthrobacter phage Sicarius2 TaxID=2836090 RepID=A0A8F3EBQ2_9CAUD|nr:hypothetical protein SEA_SICARIUS2_51 [Arthrobacter phage Sicarius2]